MRALHRLVDFYRAQLELIWDWRVGRWRLLRRGLISFGVAFVSLGLTAALLPGLVIPFPIPLALAVVVIGALGALVRPVLLALVAPISILLVLVISLAFQVFVIVALVPLVPGVRVTGLTDAFVASWVFAIINSAVTWLLTLDSDDSYYAMLVRRLIGRPGPAQATDVPGVVIVQIDGLAYSVLRHQVNAGRVPVMARWLRSGRMRLLPWHTLLPSQTSASQAGIMYGTADEIPAFRWWDKSAGRLFVSNNPGDAAAVQQRLERSGGLLDGGASIGNLFSGGADRSYLTMATLTDPEHGLGRSEAYLSFFISPYAYLHAIVLGLAEAAKEVFQARRAAWAGVEPRLPRRFPYPLLRALTNVVLRPLCTSLVVEEMLRGTPVIYVDYTDYDEIAHHSGPERAESLEALDGVDHAISTLERAAQEAPRPYRFVVLSDHGQTLGATFRQRYGRRLEDLMRDLLGGRDSVLAATAQHEQWRAVNSFLAEVSQTGGAAGAVTRRALRDRPAGMALATPEADSAAHRMPPARPPADAADRDTRRLPKQRPPADAADRERKALAPPEVVVCPSGNLAHIYFPHIDGRATLETLEERHPGMASALANHPGIGIVLVRSAEHGPLAVGRGGVRFLATDRVEGTDPTAHFDGRAAVALKRLDGMANCGDLVVISEHDPESGDVAAFEELIGSHGGLGGPQTEAFLMYPADWPVARSLVGPAAVHAQLRRWLDALPRKRAA